MHLTQNQLKELEAKLLAEKKEVEEQLNKLAGGVDFGSDIDSLEEEADEAEEMANRLGVRKTFEDRLRNIENALAKTKNGKYGFCEKCGGPIDFKLLEVMAESRLCQNCKRE